MKERRGEERRGGMKEGIRRLEEGNETERKGGKRRGGEGTWSEKLRGEEEKHFLTMILERGRLPRFPPRRSLRPEVPETAPLKRADPHPSLIRSLA